jgi:hypothetical protein
VTHSISSSIARMCTLKNLWAYFCIALVLYGVHWNVIYLEVVELYLHVLLKHDYIIYNSGNTDTAEVQIEDQRRHAEKAFRRWWSESKRLIVASRSGSGTRSDLEHSNLRNLLVACLKELGRTRPR